MIQDILPDVFHNEFRPAAKPSGHSPVLCFQERKVLVRIDDTQEDPKLVFPTADRFREQTDGSLLVYAFAVDETEYFLKIWGDPAQEVLPDGFAFLDFQEVRRNLPNVLGMVIFTGYHLHMWYRGRRFCGYCGCEVTHDSKERAVICPSCGQKNYPRIMPAVIVGVTHGDYLLQTKYSSGFRFYALIAGFTEIGETLEETVQREVMEETGLRVKNIRYYKSQPWGLAGDILAGFFCDLDGDDTISLDPNELAVAEWRHRSEIELQPDNYSLTNEMMRRFKEGKEC